MAITAITTGATMPQVGDLTTNAGRFRRHLRATGLSPRTEQSYLESVEALARFLASQGMPLDTAAITREHLEEWLIALRAAGRKPATLAIRYRSVQQFFRWAAEEGLIKTSPMAHMRPPRVPEAPPDVLRDEELAALLKVIEADKSFAGRRDAAIIRLFVASGARLSEIANLRWNPADPTSNDIDLDRALIRVLGKGGRERPIYVGAKAAKGLDRYIYDQRAKHRLAATPWLWLGPRGRLTPSGITQLVKTRGEEAGIDGLHPHAFRHAWAHANLARGMQEGEVMTLAGWRSREMLRRYAASTATESALEAAKRVGLADRL
jgi:site-specific recombinase XerD